MAADRGRHGAAGRAGTLWHLLGILALGEVVSALLAGSLALPLPLGTRICLAQALAGVSLLLPLIVPVTWGVAASLACFGLFSAPLTICA